MRQAGCGIAVRSLRIIALVLMGCLPCSAEVVGANVATETPTIVYTIDAHVVASGSAVTSSNACYRLRATIAEPVVGFAANATHALSAGFRAVTQGQSGDDLFSSSFEVCP